MGGSKTKTKTQADPWAPAQPALQQQLSGVQAHLSNPQAFQTYQGPRVAQMSGTTRAGLDDLAASAGGRTSADYLSGVIGGNFFNPAIGQLQEAVRAGVAPSINSAFSSAGLTGSSQHQGMLAKGLSQGMAQPLFNAFENDQARRLQAAGMLPGISTANAQNAITAGVMGEDYEQRNIDAARESFEEQRLAGLRPILETLPVTTGIGGLGGTSNSVSKTSTPFGQQVLGGAMMGASVLGAPWGAGTVGGMIGSGLGLGGGRAAQLPWYAASTGGNAALPQTIY